jgi:hypothetical protein
VQSIAPSGARHAADGPPPSIQPAPPPPAEETENEHAGRTN